MSSQFQIVFRGELLDGFDLVAVKLSAGKRLKAPPEQIDRVFSGKRVVLKKGLTDELAERYAGELQRIGMKVSIEPEKLKTPETASTSELDPIGEIDPGFAVPLRNEPQRVTSRDEPVFDPLKTQLSGIPEEELPPPPERWNQPTIAISQRHLNSLQADAHASSASSDPTLIVPPRRSAASEPTVVVTRGSSVGLATNASSAPETVSSSFAPTIRMPSRDSEASEPTMIVPPRHSSASEPTLIVPPRRSSSSDVTMIVPPRTSGATQPVILRSNQTLPPSDRTAVPTFDAEKTQLASSDAVADYLAAPSEQQLANATTTTAAEPEVQCPTCGDKQPKRVYCRRCGHALQLPPKQAAMGESTITKRPFARPPLTPPPAAVVATPPVTNETVLIEESAIEESGTKKSAARKGFLAAPTWFTIGLLFVLLLAVAGWLIFS